MMHLWLCMTTAVLLAILAVGRGAVTVYWDESTFSTDGTASDAFDNATQVYRFYAGHTDANRQRRRLWQQCPIPRLWISSWHEHPDGHSFRDGELLLSHSTPSERVVKREQAVVLANAINRLPEHYQDVIVLHHLEGLTLPEVAQRLGRTSDGVSKNWARALIQLRRASEDKHASSK